MNEICVPVIFQIIYQDQVNPDYSLIVKCYSSWPLSACQRNAIQTKRNSLAFCWRAGIPNRTPETLESLKHIGLEQIFVVVVFVVVVVAAVVVIVVVVVVVVMVVVHIRT